jgi:hypothetical protein
VCVCDTQNWKKNTLAQQDAVTNSIRHKAKQGKQQ